MTDIVGSLTARNIALSAEVETLRAALTAWQCPVDNTGDYVHPLWKRVHGAEWERDRMRDERDTANAQCRNLGQQLAKAGEERDLGFRIFNDICDELGCAHDNEEALMTAHKLKAALRKLVDFVESIDGRTIAIADGDTFIDDGIVVASDHTAEAYALLSPADTTAGAGAAEREAITQSAVELIANLRTMAAQLGYEFIVDDQRLETFLGARNLFIDAAHELNSMLRPTTVAPPAAPDAGREAALQAEFSRAETIEFPLGMEDVRRVLRRRSELCQAALESIAELEARNAQLEAALTPSDGWRPGDRVESIDGRTIAIADGDTFIEAPAPVTLASHTTVAPPAAPEAGREAAGEDARDLRNVLRAVLHHFGPSGAERVTSTAISLRSEQDCAADEIGLSPSAEKDGGALDLVAALTPSDGWRPGTCVRIDHDGFEGDVIGRYETREGKRGVVLQQVGTRVVHVYGEKWLKPALNTEGGV